MDSKRRQASLRLCNAPVAAADGLLIIPSSSSEFLATNGDRFQSWEGQELDQRGYSSMDSTAATRTSSVTFLPPTQRMRPRRSATNVTGVPLTWKLLAMLLSLSTTTGNLSLYLLTICRAFAGGVSSDTPMTTTFGFWAYKLCVAGRVREQASQSAAKNFTTTGASKPPVSIAVPFSDVDENMGMTRSSN